jgi:hypothetical protein
MTLQLPDSLYQPGIAIWGCNSWVRTKCSLVGWFYTHEQLLLDSKFKDILHKRKKAAHQTQHTQTEERNRDYSAHRGREKKGEREKERKKVAWEAVLQGKDKAPYFRQQNHITHSLPPNPPHIVSVTQ